MLTELRATVLLASAYPSILEGGTLSLESALALARQIPSALVADEMIKSAFQAGINSEPAHAFALLPEVPSHLLMRLSRDLASGWAEAHGADAARAFYKAPRVGDWRVTFMDALASWGAKGDPQAQAAALTDGDTRQRALANVAMSLPSPGWKRALSIVEGLPVSNLTTPIVGRLAEDLAAESALDALQLFESQTDPYRRESAADGLSNAAAERLDATQLDTLLRDALQSNSGEL